MSNSPNRSYMTHKRQPRVSPAPHGNLTQKSPLISSPNLNEEVDIDNHKLQAIDLRTKIQTLLKHNSQLLNQNAMLSEMVNGLRVQLQSIRRATSDKAIIERNSKQQMSLLVQQIEVARVRYAGQVAALMEEINQLHKQCHEVQITKNEQIKMLKDAHDRQLAFQVSQLRGSLTSNNDLLHLQIAKLKETIEQKEFEATAIQSNLTSQIASNQSELNLLRTQLQHSKRVNDLQIRQTQRRVKQQKIREVRQVLREKEVQVKESQNRITRMKKEIVGKQMELEQVVKKSNAENEQVFIELSSLKKHNQNLLEEIQDLTEANHQKLLAQKARISQLSALQLQNQDALFKSQIQSLNNQKQKLILVCMQKNEEIKRLYGNMKEMRQFMEDERNSLNGLIISLRNKLREVQRSNLQQIELLKVKMAQLHNADITTLTNYYNDQMKALLLELSSEKESHEADRQKLYALLLDNDELRKNFQVEISKQKARIQDMKVKFAAARLQFKEQITSLGTKMELTSQTLVRQTEQKQKGAQFFQAQKRKFYHIIDGKDKEITSLHEAIQRQKELQDQEITSMKSQISVYRDALLAKQQQFKEMKHNLETEYQRKSLRLLQECRVNPDEQISKENEDLKIKLVELEKECFKRQKDIQFLMRENKSLQGQLGLRAGFLQTMQLQSSAAIQDQKSKIKILMSKNEVSMKEYYQSKITSKQTDNEALRKQLAQKQALLRELIKKCNHLQKKLKELLDAQTKLSDFQEKIVNLGMDQNLVKNMSELFKKK